MHVSACIEMLYAPETGLFERRIGLAANAGFKFIEFWKWTTKDLDQIRAELTRTGLGVAGIVAEPMVSLNEPLNHSSFIEGLKRSVETAVQLSAPILIAQAGNEIESRPRAAQRAALTECLLKASAVLKGSSVRLALEPLNSLIDHPGYFLTDTGEALDILDDVDSKEVGLLYDVYHSMVMGEVPAVVLSGRVHRVYHVHVADSPGRNQPGTGTLPLGEVLTWLQSEGYQGGVGLEFQPSGDTPSALAQAARFLAPTIAVPAM